MNISSALKIPKLWANYAAKLATSPGPIDNSPAHHNHSLRYAWPPWPVLMEPFLASRRRPFFFQNETPSNENTGAHRQSQTNVKVILSMPLAHFACYLKSYCESHWSRTEKLLVLEAGWCSLQIQQWVRICFEEQRSSSVLRRDNNEHPEGCSTPKAAANDIDLVMFCSHSV